MKRLVDFFVFVVITAASVHAIRPGFQKEHLRCVEASSRNGLYPRFSQSKSKFNLFIFLTNLIFPQQYPRVYKHSFQTGGCPGWYLDFTSTDQKIENDWIFRNGWSYSTKESIISFNGYSTGRENSHMFPFFWLPRRVSSRDSLIKRNFFCQNTQVQSDVMLRGAKEAGILFRVIGERNFWALLVQEGKGVSLIQVREGEPVVKLRLSNISIQQNKFYTINVQEWMGDVVVTASEYGEAKPVQARYEQKSEDEVFPKAYKNDQGAVGLIANEGSAVFRNAFMGDVNWAPNTGSPGKISDEMNTLTQKDREQALARDLDLLKELPDDLKGWCPEGALCAGHPFN